MKVALITGGTRGIGRGIVENLLNEAPEFDIICATGTNKDKITQVLR